MDIAGEVWSEELVCNIKGLAYVFAERRCVMWLPEANCTDMSGAIRLAKRIDPKVKQIQTLSDNEMDTCYILEKGKWRAIMPNERAWYMAQDAIAAARSDPLPPNGQP